MPSQKLMRFLKINNDDAILQERFMKILQIEKTILVWDCGIKEHGHKTKKAAENCYSIKRGIPTNTFEIKKQIRNRKITIDALENGFEQLSPDKYGVSLSTCISIAKRYLRTKCWHKDLSGNGVNKIIELLKNEIVDYSDELGCLSNE